MIPVLPHWSAQHATVSERAPRYALEVTSHPVTIYSKDLQVGDYPCSRAPQAEGECPTCGVAWAKHGGARNA